MIRWIYSLILVFFIVATGFAAGGPSFTGGGGGTAAETTVDASGFTGNLGVTDTDAQTALDTIDAVSLGGDTTETNQDDAWAAVGASGTESGIDVTYQDLTNDVDFIIDVTPTSGSATLEVAEDSVQVKYGVTLTEGASGLDVKADGVDSAHYAADSIDNEHINWTDIDNLGDEGAIIAADESSDATTFVLFVTGATGSAAKTGTNLTFDSSTGILTATAFAGDITGDVTGNVSGTAATVTGATQASITTLANATTVGTVGAGTWEATDVAIAHGGTNSSTALNNDFVMVSNTGAIVESATVTVTELALLNGETDLASQAELDAVAALVDTDDEIIAIINASPGTYIDVAAGGLGVGTLADGGLVIGNAAGDVEVVAAGTTSQILVGGGASTAPVWGTNIPTAVTIGTAYVYRVGGTDVADADVVDTITASNYLPLAGGTLSGEVTVDDLGFEFAEGDTISDCSNFSATGGGIFYDDSDGKFKKCQDNVLTDLDTDTGGAPALSAVTAPTAAWGVAFDDEEKVTWTTSQNTAGNFFTIDNSVAAVGNQVYLLNLDYSVDDNEPNADYIIAQDAGGTVFTLGQDGDIVTQGDADIVGALTAGTIASDAGLSGTTIIGTAKISTTVTTEQLRLNYDATNYATWTVDATGATTVTTVDADGAVAHLTFSPNGTIILTPATDVVGALTAASVTSDANVAGTTYGSNSSISDAELLTLDDGATTELLVGGGAGSAPVWTTASGTGAPVRVGSPVFTGIVTIPIAADPTTDADGEMSFDTDGWGTGYDALEIWNGTASAYVVATTASDTPANGEIPTFNTGGTITWEAAGAGDVLADGSIPFTAEVTITNAAPALTLLDSDSAAGTGILSFQATGANDIVASLKTDVAGTPTTFIELDGVSETVDLLKNTVLTGTFTDGTATLNSGAWSAITTLAATGDVSTTEDVKIGDSKYIGSTSDPLAIQIEADGDVVFTDDLAVVAVTASGLVTASLGIVLADGQSITFDEAAADPDDADVVLTAADGILTLTASNGANNENLTIDFDAASNDIAIGSGTSVGQIDFGTIGLETDSLDVSDGNITSVGIIQADELEPEAVANGSLIIQSGQTNANTLKLQGYDVDGTAYTDVITITSANAVLMAIDTSDWDIDATGAISGVAIDEDTSDVRNLADVSIAAGAGIDATKIANGSISDAEFQYLNGLTAVLTTSLATGTVTISTLLDVNEEVDIDFDNADEEVNITNSAEYGADGAQVTIANTDADVGAAMYLLRLRYTDDGQANADFMVMEDNNGDDMITFTDGGVVTAVTLTDGTFSVTSGAITGATTIAAATSVSSDWFDVTGAEDLDIGSADVLDITLVENGGTYIFDNGFSAAGEDLGSATAEWGDIYIADDKDLKLGSNQDWDILYDETTNDRLEFTYNNPATANTGDVYWEMTDAAADSTFTIANSDATYTANLVVEGEISTEKLTQDPVDDPFWYFDPATASESEWWVGVNHDGVGDDNDAWELRQSATPGSSVRISVAASTGNAVISGDLTVTGDDLTMGTNTAGMLLIGDNTNYNPTAMGGDGTIGATGTLAVSDLTIASEARGGILTFNPGGAGGWEVLTTGTAGKYLTTDGTDLSWASVTATASDCTPDGGIQYEISGAFACEAAFYYTQASNVLTVAAIGVAAEEVLIFTDVATALNEITITNAATTDKPSIIPSGETNVGLIIDAKGIGEIIIGSADAKFSLVSDAIDISNTGVISNATWQGTAVADTYVADDITIDLATLATTITVTDNEDTAENNPITFVAGADPDGGSLGIETDGDFHYNPSTGTVTATVLVGTTDVETALGASYDTSGEFDTLFAAAGTKENITPVDTADESAAFYPILVDGATGDQATETDGELSYNPSTDTLTIVNVAGSGTVTGTTITASTGFVLGDGDYVGVAGNEIITFNTAGTIVVSGGIFSSTGGEAALTPVTGATEGFAAGFTGANLYGGTYIANSDGGDLQLPLMAAGMNFCIITLGAIQVVADTNVADGYLMDGTTGAEGANLTNLSAAGDIACFQYYTADDWLITTNGWTAE